MSSQERKINNLLDKIRSEHKPPAAAQMSHEPSEPKGNSDMALNRPALSLDMNRGSMRNKRPEMLPFASKSNDNVETDRKLKEITQNSGILTIRGVSYRTELKDMVHLEELGNGTCGHVVKMRHAPSGEIIAVKQMRRSGNSEENKRIIMDIEVVLKSHDCNYIVQCLGCFISDAEVWICMELMTTCFDKLLKRLGKPIPEEILGKVTVATVEALSYLKDKHGVIHRDVKPSNILLDTRGYVKLCDFGISGRLVDSMAKTRSAGCAAYLAPERIEPPDPKNPDYDIRADVWSLGITLVELATGVFPYPDCHTDFEVLTKVLGQEPPSLPDTFSVEFREFVKCCLIKDQKQRPKYTKLKNLPFIKKYETKYVDVGAWVVNALREADGVVVAPPRSLPTQSTFRRFFTATNHHRPAATAAPSPPPPTNLTNGNGRYRPLKASEKDEGSAESGGHASRLQTFQNHIGNHQHATYSPFRAYQNHLEARNRDQLGSTSPFMIRKGGSADKKKEDSGESMATRWNSPASRSPLPLRNQLQEEPETRQQQFGNTSPIVLQRFYHQQKQQQMAKDAQETAKKRFSSYIKLQLGNDRSDTSGRTSRHQSPDPPPRLNRSGNQSPLGLHRTFNDANASPILSPTISRRYVSPAPPMPPPRRVPSCESSSVPGSPQHFRARFHYTPEPQRRFYPSDGGDVCRD